MKFKFAVLELVEIYGTVDITVYFGGMKGPWYKIAEGVIQAEIGCIGSHQQPRITKTSRIQKFKKQSRSFSTMEFAAKGKGCSPEIQLPGMDKGFQLLIEWRGQMGIREVQFNMDPDPSYKKIGECQPTELCEHNAIDEGGNKLS